MSPAVNGARKILLPLLPTMDGGIHMNDAEGLARLLNDSVLKSMSKIYFDAFRQVTMSGGQLYPDATRA